MLAKTKSNSVLSRPRVDPKKGDCKTVNKSKGNAQNVKGKKKKKKKKEEK